MTMKATPVTVDWTGNHFEVQGTIATSGTVPSTGHGDILSFLASALGTGPVPFPPVTSVPDWCEIYEAPPAGTSASGYYYNFSPGTTLGTGKVQVFQSAGSAAPLAEVTSTAWATIAPQNLSFIARFPKRGI